MGVAIGTTPFRIMIWELLMYCSGYLLKKSCLEITISHPDLNLGRWIRLFDDLPHQD